ncbi:MAG TPA: amidohydrolase, partial [Firmicutes bacterium]|nr:amidohydrolase [Bacillota bacterium]
HLREAFVKAQNYLNKMERAKNDPEKMPDRDLRMEAVIRVLKGEIPLRAHAHRADDILTAIRIAEEFGVKIVLEHCTEGHKIADIIAAKKIPAIVGPTLTTRSKYELKDRSLITPGVLAKAGVKIAIMTDHPVIPLHLLPIAVGVAVREGLPKEDALKTITINPAEIIGVADRVGSLEKGKDADIVIWSGDPTETATKCEKVIVNGELVVGKK